MEEPTPAGYTHLFWKYYAAPELLRQQAFIRHDSRPKETVPVDSHVEVTYPRRFKPGDSDYEHLVFALKNEGVQMFALSRIFPHVNPLELAARISAKPTSKYGRQIFFLYELLTGSRLNIRDFTDGTYCDVLDPQRYFTGPSIRSRRHRVNDNLLGDGSFCPTVRRTEALVSLIERRLDLRAETIADSAEPAILARATQYLYSKETKSSFEIEREDPGNRMDRYVEQLAQIGRLPLNTQAGLTDLQNSLVDPQFADDGYRRDGSDDVYVGQNIGFREKVHHVGVNSESTPELMGAWEQQREVVGDGGAVIEAACRSFSFVFIHPFSDGNGRIHRLLLHHVLARRRYLPGDLVVPISSVIVNDLQKYDATLEDFSTLAMRPTEVTFTLEDDGRISLHQQKVELYRFPDLTVQAEATFGWLQRAVEEDLPRELAFLQKFDEAIAEMREVVEMPDRLERLFARLAMQNQGRIANKKRRHFSEFDDETVAALEAAVTRVLNEPGAGAD